MRNRVAYGFDNILSASSFSDIVPSIFNPFEFEFWFVFISNTKCRIVIAILWFGYNPLRYSL